MKAMFLPIVIPFVLATLLPAETCREVVRDSSGRIVQTIERQNQAGGTVQSVTRDASGRIIGTSISHPNSGGGTNTEYRDSSGRLTGSATTQANAGSSRTTYRDASGRLPAYIVCGPDASKPISHMSRTIPNYVGIGTVVEISGAGTNCRK